MTLQEVILAVQDKGLRFEPLSDFDRNAFAGAPKDALIASSDVAVYILSEDSFSVITEDRETTYSFKDECFVEF